MFQTKSMDEWRPFLCMFSTGFAFAVVNILLKEVLNQGLNRLVFITYRLAISAVFLAPIGYCFERTSSSKLTLRVSCYLFISAIVGASTTMYFFLIGIQYTSATFASAFINIVPVVTFIIALPFRLETVNLNINTGRVKALGTMVSIAGAIVLTSYKGMPLFNHMHSHTATLAAHHEAFGLSTSNKTERWTFGLLALVAGTLLWSSWYLLQSQIGKIYPLQYSSTAIMSFFGATQSAVLCLIMDRDPSIWILRGKIEILSVLYSGIVGSGLCFVGMAWCVRKRGPVFTAAFSPLVQIISALFEIPLLHDQLHLGSVLGSGIVIIGLYILLWGKNKEGRSMSVDRNPVKVGQDVENEEPQLRVITVTSDPKCP
uniref:WAT1-related protein n=1 Tax=Kalanchoe fedtschenkoi TaxID=63787 RepID=A0A7N0T7F5_KALFE